MAKPSDLPVTFSRKAPSVPLSPFTDYFRGFEKVKAVQDVFGGRTDEVLGRLGIRFISNRYMYMGVSDQDGNIGVGTYHLKNSDLRTLYLDIVHELFHVKQFMDDREYFAREHRRYLKKTGFDTALYYRSPIEVPAYRHAVDEAKRIGMSFDEIADYLKMGPVHPKVFARLLEDVGLERGMATAPPVRLNIAIKRSVRIRLYPFADYFKGFEQVGAVRALFGDRTEEVLNRLRVEFSGSPMRAITPAEEDGHLQVSVPYLESGDERLLYFDVLVCLNILKRISGEKRLADKEGIPNEVLVESFAASVREAKRLGVSDSDLSGQMMMPRFAMSSAEFQRFLARVGLGRRKRKE